MADTNPTVRAANVAVLIKLQTGPGVEAVPDPTTDAVPVEADSINRSSPWTTEASGEATGSYVTGAPLVVGQAATVSFRSRIKGAGNGAVYSPTVKPPLHAALASSGMRPQFTAAIASALASAGSATSATLAAGYPATARALLGMPLSVTAGAGSGRTPFVTEYTAARIATLAETFALALDGTSSIALPANWTYAGTSPSDATARLTDHPLATIYIYRDGQLWRYMDCRGTLALDGRSARPGFGAFNYGGVFLGKSDAAMPANLVVAGHMAPTLVRGGAGSSVALLDRKELSLSTWSLASGSQVTNPDDPNTNYGFGAGQIGERTPVLTVDPLATLSANRDTIAQIGAGATMSALLRHGATAGNMWGVTMPLLQPTGESDTNRNGLVGEQITLQARSLGKDAFGRDTDVVLAFA